MDLRESGDTVSFSITSIISPLVSAFLEWILMFMIFVDSGFAYLVTRFARRSQLQTPCLLCSRLDHFLGNHSEGFYWDLICNNHKSKISSLVLCKLHNNLVDVHRLCESCISSFINKSDSEAYRLLVGKLGTELGENIDSRKCSCCKEQCISRTSIQNLLDRKSIGNKVSDCDASPSKFNGDESREILKESSQLGQSPHAEYSRIKVTSDTESDGPFSENESLIRDTAAKYDLAEPQISNLADSPPTEKLIHLASPIKMSLSESEDHTYSNHDVESEGPVWHGLEELHWKQADHNDDISKPSELASSRDVHPLPNVESNKTNATITPELEKEVPIECKEASNLGHDLRNEIHMDSKPHKTDTTAQMTEHLDLGDAYKLALGTKGRQLSGRLLEQRSMTESTRASQDLKLLLSQLSFARGFDPSSDLSPKVSVSTEDSGAIGMQIFQRRISLERNESNLSLDGSSVTEIEGESELDRLRRQVEHDKKILVNLYKELEEERNASAIAANQAMAMITRLQEEKAAFHMEALQCVRMMEEQAEYDSEALQKANEMVMEKEKQIQDFEYELELYRNQFGGVPLSNEPRPESESEDLTDIVKRIDVETKMLNVSLR